MIISIALIVGVLAVVGSWLAAVRFIQSDKFSAAVAANSTVDTHRRDDVLAYTTL
jgi:hypothetical protein